MKNLKVLILVFGLLGIISLFMPIMPGMPSWFSALSKGDMFQLVLMLAAFGVPAAVAGMGLAKPPAQAWHGAAALAGFALGAVKFRVWKVIGSIGEVPMSWKLMTVAVVGGLVVSVLALVKPESKA